MKQFIYCSTVLNIKHHLLPVKHAVWEARTQWKNIGRELGLSEDIIKSIHDPDDGECLHEVLSKWLQTGNATIYDLLEALEDPIVAHRDIANEIRALNGEERIKVGLDPITDSKKDFGNSPANRRSSVQCEPDK